MVSKYRISNDTIRGMILKMRAHTRKAAHDEQPGA